MCINMPKNIKEERLRWILPIHKKEKKMADMTEVCPYSQKSLERKNRCPAKTDIGVQLNSEYTYCNNCTTNR